jgi:flagellar motor protein MotB
MADESKRPIIIVKKKITAGGHHGGAWKVAYADFVTAMMAFFMVMWLVASVNEGTARGDLRVFQEPQHGAGQERQGRARPGRARRRQHVGHQPGWRHGRTADHRNTPDIRACRRHPRTSPRTRPAVSVAQKRGREAAARPR